MTSRLTHPRSRFGFLCVDRHLTALVMLVFCLAGCQKTLQVDDPQLKPIQEMLESQLPVGSSEATVIQFLSSRGYATEPSEKPGTIVAIIRHIDTEKLMPVTARVTFYFDASRKLNTFEIVRTLNQPLT
jgi:hypothetical protein